IVPGAVDLACRIEVRMARMSRIVFGLRFEVVPRRLVCYALPCLVQSPCKRRPVDHYPHTFLAFGDFVAAFLGGTSKGIDDAERAVNRTRSERHIDRKST